MTSVFIPDNLPGASAGPPSNYVPAPVGYTLAQQGLPQGDSLVQRAQLAHDNARRQYEAWRPQVPAHLLASHAKDFAGTPAAVEAGRAADAVAKRATDAAGVADALRESLSVGLTPEEQTRADRWWRAQLPLLEKATAGGVANALNNLAGHATDWQLATIAEMGGPLLQSKGVNPDTLTAILEQNVPELKAANAARQTALQAHSIVQQNRRSLEKSIQQGTTTSPPVSAAAYDPDAS